MHSFSSHEKNTACYSGQTRNKDLQRIGGAVVLLGQL